MRWVLATVLMLGVFTEVRTPAKGYECLHVQYRRMYYKALKFERSRFTGQVTLTMRSTDSMAALLGKPERGRTIKLSGYDLVTDSNRCRCIVYRQCVDR